MDSTLVCLQEVCVGGESNHPNPTVDVVLLSKVRQVATEKIKALRVWGRWGEFSQAFVPTRAKKRTVTSVGNSCVDSILVFLQEVCVSGESNHQSPTVDVVLLSKVRQVTTEKIKA